MLWKFLCSKSYRYISLWMDYWHLRLLWLQWDWIRDKLSATLWLKTSNSFSVHSFSCVWFIYWGCECCHVILCFGSGEIVQLEVVDGGLVCSSGVQLEDFGDKSDNCYVVNAAVYVGYWIPVQAIASCILLAEFSIPFSTDFSSSHSSLSCSSEIQDESHSSQHSCFQKEHPSSDQLDSLLSILWVQKPPPATSFSVFS